MIEEKLQGAPAFCPTARAPTRSPRSWQSHAVKAIRTTRNVRTLLRRDDLAPAYARPRFCPKPCASSFGCIEPSDVSEVGREAVVIQLHRHRDSHGSVRRG